MNIAEDSHFGWEGRKPENKLSTVVIQEIEQECTCSHSQSGGSSPCASNREVVVADQHPFQAVIILCIVRSAYLSSNPSKGSSVAQLFATVCSHAGKEYGRTPTVEAHGPGVFWGHSVSVPLDRSNVPSLRIEIWCHCQPYFRNRLCGLAEVPADWLCRGGRCDWPLMSDGARVGAVDLQVDHCDCLKLHDLEVTYGQDAIAGVRHQPSVDVLNVALENAVSHGSSAVVKGLLAAKANPNTNCKEVVYQESGTVSGHILILAALAKEASMEKVGLLLAAGAKLDKGEQAGPAALYAAVCDKKLDVAEVLLAANVDPTAKARRNGDAKTPLDLLGAKIQALQLHAVDHCDVDVVQSLSRCLVLHGEMRNASAIKRIFRPYKDTAQCFDT